MNPGDLYYVNPPGFLSKVRPAVVVQANAKMVYEVYAKWIDDADKSREKNRVNAWLNVTPASQETLKSA